MKLKSLGIKTDIHVSRYSGSVIYHGDYIVIHTPSNPGYWFGNHIIFDRPPQKGDFIIWRELFKKEIYNKNKSEHMLFRWDTITGEKGDLAEFLEKGFMVEEDVLLSATTVIKPSHYNPDITTRIISGDEEWEMSFENQILCRDKSTGENLEDHKIFKRKQLAEYRRMCEDGLCEWYGVFKGNQLAADMGVFLVNGVGNFQDVGTAPNFRRQGICGTAVYDISRRLLERKNIHTMMMTADENYHAARIYESVGFRRSEKTVHLLHPTCFKPNNEDKDPIL